METRRFITVFTTARHLFSSWDRRTKILFPQYQFQYDPSTPRSSKCSPSFSPWNLPPPPPHTRNMLRPFYPPWPLHPNIWRGTKILYLLIMLFSSVSSHFLYITVVYLPHRPFLDPSQALSSSLNAIDQVSHPYQTTAKFLTRNHQCAVTNQLKQQNYNYVYFNPTDPRGRARLLGLRVRTSPKGMDVCLLWVLCAVR